MAEQQPEVASFYDRTTGSVQYVVIDGATNDCAIIDPVLNFDENSARTSTESTDEIRQFIADRGASVAWVLDAHPHADHFSAAFCLAERYGAPRAIGEKVIEVQKLWKDIYGLGDEFAADGRQFDRLFAAGDTFRIGEIDARVMFSPGHTAASITYVIGDAVFVHDTLFQPDFGTARADFPGGDARELYRSIQRILELPDETRVFTGHDYMPGGRDPQWESTVGAQRRHNPHLQNTDEQAFVDMRQKRDAELPLPELMLASLQVNIRGGRLPPPENNGRSHLKIPVNYF